MQRRLASWSEYGVSQGVRGDFLIHVGCQQSAGTALHFKSSSLLNNSMKCVA